MDQLELAHATLATFFPKADIGPVEILFMDDTEFLHTFGTDAGAMVLPKVPGAGRLGGGFTMVLDQPRLSDSTRAQPPVRGQGPAQRAPVVARGNGDVFLQSRIGSVDGKWLACFGASWAPLGDKYIRLPLDKFFAVSWQDYANSEPGSIEARARC